MKCYCGSNVPEGRLHYPGNDPENGPAHRPSPFDPRFRTTIDPDAGYYCIILTNAETITTVMFCAPGLDNCGCSGWVATEFAKDDPDDYGYLEYSNCITETAGQGAEPFNEKCETPSHYFPNGHSQPCECGHFSHAFPSKEAK